MKWFFCWCQETDFRDDHNWKDLIRASVQSALQNTTLQPHFIYDGNRSDFTDEMTRKGVKVIFHKLSFETELNAHRPLDKGFQAVARGAFLRFDIPLVANTSDEYVLYTDADVIFLEPVNFEGYAPKFIGAAPQFDKGCRADMNSGVMLLNLAYFRQIHAELVAFTLENLHLGLDQEVLRQFIGNDYLLLPDIYNWKPYWGINPYAAIIHWHGPKPETVANLLHGRITETHDAWQPLLDRDNESYQHYLELHQSLSAAATPPKALEHRWENLALGKTATQSSVSIWSGAATPEADAIGALDGVINGRAGFHTDYETQPWWMVDLGDVVTIAEIRLFNRLDYPGLAERACYLAVDVGMQPDKLAEIYRREDPLGFGGMDGHPLLVKPTMVIFGRYVRVRLLNTNFLHLDQVEVYGEALPGFVSRALI